MNLCLSSALLLSVAAASWDTAEAKSVAPMHRGDVQKLLAKSRRLEEDEEDDVDEEDMMYGFLPYYKLKVIGCKASESGDSSYGYSSVIYRLCPSSGDCDSEDENGCSEGYGDYIVDIYNFIDAYAETLRDDRRRLEEEEFKLEEYAECREFEQEDEEEEDEEDRKLQNNGAYYIGPACTEEGTDIKLELFTDNTCTTVSSEVSYEDLSNGYSLPYSDGGIVSPYCFSCSEQNDDGDYEASDFCKDLMDNSGKCETEMNKDEYYEYSYENDESQCELIQELTYVETESGMSTGGKVFLSLFIIAAVLGAGYFVFQQQKKKKAANQSTGNETSGADFGRMA